MSRKCIMCSKELIGQKTRYCSSTCKSKYFQKQRNILLNGLEGEDLDKYLKNHATRISTKNGEIRYLRTQLKSIRDKIDKILSSGGV